MPIIRLCHRVICFNRETGGHSANGGLKLKKELLKIEALSL